MTTKGTDRLVKRLRGGDLDVVGRDALQAWLTDQRWFGGKADRVAAVEILAAPLLLEEPAPVVDALVEVRVEAGTHDVYQVPLVFGRESAGPAAITDGEHGGVSDALAAPEIVAALVEVLRSGEPLAYGDAWLRLGRADSDLFPARTTTVRTLGAEQSNTSHIIDEALVLKTYRRLEAGPNPELELLAFFAGRGFEHVPRLAGWASWEGAPLDATLAVAQTFVPGDGDGWETTLGALATGDGAKAIDRLQRLGEVTGEMHAVLASDPDDQAFAPDGPEPEAIAFLAARVEEEVQEVFRGREDDERLGELAARVPELCEYVGGLSQAATAGRMIRIHGDYHLGQAVWNGHDWVILDFEGEPARSLVERRRKQSPLRDVAGMLRSFAYVAEASDRAGARPDPRWEASARAAFMEGYRDRVDSSLLPPSEDALERLLRIYELQKAVYELRYELENRPAWVDIPVATLTRLLAAAAVS